MKKYAMIICLWWCVPIMSVGQPTISLLTKSTLSTYWGHIAAGVTAEASKGGYVLQDLSPRQNTPQAQCRAISQVSGDVLILAPHAAPCVEQAVAALPIPVICLDGELPAGLCDGVVRFDTIDSHLPPEAARARIPKTGKIPDNIPGLTGKTLVAGNKQSGNQAVLYVQFTHGQRPANILARDMSRLVWEGVESDIVGEVYQREPYLLGVEAVKMAVDAVDDGVLSVSFVEIPLLKIEKGDLSEDLNVRLTNPAAYYGE